MVRDNGIPVRIITRNTVNESKYHFQDVIIPDAGTMRGLEIPVASKITVKDTLPFDRKYHHDP